MLASRPMKGYIDPFFALKWLLFSVAPSCKILFSSLIFFFFPLNLSFEKDFALCLVELAFSSKNTRQGKERTKQEAPKGKKSDNGFAPNYLEKR